MCIRDSDYAGHGTNMFAAEPELTALIIGWLGEQLAAGQ